MMDIIVRKYEEKDLPEMVEIWNAIVEDGTAFPYEEPLTIPKARQFFDSMTHCAVAVDVKNDQICGLYKLHPNNVGRCGHICNASYVVKEDYRGNSIGEKLVLDSLEQGRLHGFEILQFNAVVATNVPARRLYEKLGFVQLGVIPKGFRMKDGHYEDICPYYCEL